MRLRPERNISVLLTFYHHCHTEDLAQGGIYLIFTVSMNNRVYFVKMVSSLMYDCNRATEFTKKKKKKFSTVHFPEVVQKLN